VASQFIRVHNTYVRLDAIGYIDFLDSGRSMIYISGMNMEKQHISVEEDETRRLREYLDSQTANRKAESPVLVGKPPANPDDDELYKPKTYRFSPR
jgi:hypothetical protein